MGSAARKSHTRPKTCDAFAGRAERISAQFPVCRPSGSYRVAAPPHTMMRTRFQSDQNLCASTQKSLSNAASRGLGCLRFRTASCCRRARFSSKRLRRVWKKRQIEASKSPMACNMAGYYRRLPVNRSDQVVDFIGGQSFGEPHWSKLLSAEKMIWRSSAFCKSPISPGHRTEDASRVGLHLEGNCVPAIRRCT